MLLIVLLTVVALVLCFLIVVAVANQRASQRALGFQQPTRPTTARQPLTRDIEGEIARLIDDGKKIQAIKEYREATGSDLRTAKEVVDNWHLSREQASLSHRAEPSGSASTGSGDPGELGPHGLPRDVETEIELLIGENKKIVAIKVYRDATGSGLKAAKDAVDRWHSDTTPR